MKQLIVFVLASNSQGEPEILAYDIAVPQKEIDDGEANYFNEARERAESDGYDVISIFDSSDMAGKQLLGIAQVYGDEGRFLPEILKPKTSKIFLVEFEDSRGGQSEFETRATSSEEAKELVEIANPGVTVLTTREITQSKQEGVLSDAADLMEAFIVHGDVSKDAFNSMIDECRTATGNLPQYIRVEYDTTYTGGDYKGVGKFAYIPELMVEQAVRACKFTGIEDDPVHLAFRKLTHMDSMHIIHYSSDERYTKDGGLIRS